VLLATLNVDFTVRVSEAPELEQGEDPAAVAVENAMRKARAASRVGAREAVLACDTLVTLDGVIYGKPPDAETARRTIGALSGRTHEVISGLALLLPGERTTIEQRTALARTRVSFRALNAEQVRSYVATGEWRGRSGGYAIQGAGSKLATMLDGQEDNVVGLPLGTLLELYPELLQIHSHA
jgi:septum formation protein